ncbi:TonB-dependent receptor [uncultured Marivirga sp.]|uniref:TonB-dependent receptor n=1 Tax=uncultured Marivirga sp. TaxID=1123707 RepID=UPI0030EDDCA0
MKAITLTIFSVILFSCAVLAQKSKDYYSMEGKVVDSLNTPIPYANVLLKDTTTNEIKSFAVTDASGKFKMTIETGVLLELRASFIGYVPFIKHITTDPDRIQNLIIPLSQDQGLMDEVQVVKEMPVTLSGDTLIYKTEAFTKGNERKLEDVLKKLPGVEVDEDGSVTVQGKKVDKLLVEGKKFFDGDSKMAVKNLPARAIDKVQVLKGYQENSTLKNVNTNDQIAMNITLKEDQKSIIFGDLTLGAGLRNSYAGHGNAFYYSKDLSLNAILDANNIGEQAFNFNDYQRMKQAQNPWGLQGGALKIEERQDRNTIPQKDKTQVQELTSNFAGLNINYQASRKWQHQAYMIANTADVLEQQRQNRRFLSENGPEPENSINREQQKYGSILGQYQLDYLASPFSNWQYKSQWLSSRNTADRFSISNWAGGQETDIESENVEWSWNQQLNYYTQLNPDHILSVENQFLWRNSQSGNIWDLQYGLKNEADSSIVRFENGEQDIKTLQSELHYYWIWNKKNHLDVSLSYQHRLSTLNRTLENEEDQNLDDYRIDFSRTFSIAAAGLQWKSRVKSFLFLPGLSYFYLQDERMSVREEDVRATSNPHYLLPNFKVKYDINSVQGLDFIFQQEIRSPQEEWLTEALQLRNYQNIGIGNAALRPAFYNSLQLNYHFFNLFNGMNAFLFSSFNQVQHSFQEATDFNGLVNNSSLINSSAPQYDLNYNGKIDKRFKTFRLTLESNGLYQNYTNRLNEVEVQNEHRNQNHSLAFQTNLGQYLTSSIKYGLQLTEYANGVSNNQFNLQSFTNRWEAVWNENFEMNFDVQYQLYDGTNTLSDWWLANAELSYEWPERSFRFDIQVFNIFDTKAISRDFLSEYFVSTYQNFIQGRRALLKVNYTF